MKKCDAVIGKHQGQPRWGAKSCRLAFTKLPCDFAKQITFAAILIGALCATLGLGQLYAHSKPPTTQDIIQLEQKWASAVSGHDVATLEKLLADNLTHIHATGRVETKAQFIDAIRSGDRKYAPIVPEDLNVRIFGDTAIVTGKFDLKVVSKGKEITGVNLFTHVFAKTPAGWQLVAHQATTLPAAK
ncbi:MAG: nuclear transport factor 2 family protein [Desulfomonile tiedjei]|nr:nuclear transport factor 2 family protein [Desulfomonile tiedjei]